MNSNYNNIDNVLKRELSNYSVSPPDEVWYGIETQLNYNKRLKFKKIYRIAAAVAAIAIIGSVTLVTINNSPKDEKIGGNNVLVENEPAIHNSDVVHVDQNQENTTKSQPSDEINHTKQSKAPAKTLYAQSIRPEQQSHLIKDKKDAEENRETKVLDKLTGLPVKIETKENSFSLAEKNAGQNRNNYNVVAEIADFYAFADELEKPKAKSNKWIIGGEFSPLYSYRLITQGAIVESSYYNQLESPVTSYAGGVNLQYKTNKRLSMQTGVYYSSMGQALDYLSVYANQAYSLVADKFKDRYIHNYELQNSAGTISFSTPYVVIDERANRVQDISSNKNYSDVSDPIFQDLKAEIQQNFQYIEVPVIIRYKLIDKVLDFNIIGGIGANFLIGNNVYLVQGNAREIIGETDGVSTINYSGSIGFGIEYPVLNRISLRLEPSLKYYINAINSNSSYESHPYAFGIYTGFNYSF